MALGVLEGVRYLCRSSRISPCSLWSVSPPPPQSCPAAPHRRTSAAPSSPCTQGPPQLTRLGGVMNGTVPVQYRYMVHLRESSLSETNHNILKSPPGSSSAAARQPQYKGQDGGSDWCLPGFNLLGPPGFWYIGTITAVSKKYRTFTNNFEGKFYFFIPVPVLDCCNRSKKVPVLNFIRK